MAKRSPKKKATVRRDLVSSWDPWLPLLPAVVAFALYWPSLQSDFVYDARIDILSEGFITSLSNLPAVLSLKVLGMNLILADRPGQILYLMLNAAVWGKNPWGYHLLSNLLHAANVALLCVLLRRLVAAEPTGLLEREALKTRLAIMVATLLFAVHPIQAEAVSAVNYSSDLLVAFFAFLALLAGTAFRVDDRRTAILAGGAGTLCAFAAVTCKESGVATCLLLMVYWFLYRRQEARGPWLIFLSATVAVTAAFLAARFSFAVHNTSPEGYLGGSFSQVFLIQPRLWVYLMGKILVPVHFSADYTLDNVSGISTPLAFILLGIVVLLQTWLATRSRIGALGVAVFWLGLATVSNFIPLYKILADRFYYLPMAGVAMQLLALWLMTFRSRLGFGSILAVGVTLLPLTMLTVVREKVFATENSLWVDTVQASPSSWQAHYNLGANLSEKGQPGKAMIEFQKAIELNPKSTSAHTDMGAILLKQGQVALAISYFQTALQIDPDLAETLGDLGVALAQQGKVDEAIVCYRKAEKIKPDLGEVYYNFGLALVDKGNLDEAVAQFQKMVALDPTYADAHTELGIIFSQQGKVQDSIAQFREVVRLRPNDPDAQHNLATEQAAADKAAAGK
jgi:Flp pilus assembly protein TadD